MRLINKLINARDLTITNEHIGIQNKVAEVKRITVNEKVQELAQKYTEKKTVSLYQTLYSPTQDDIIKINNLKAFEGLTKGNKTMVRFILNHKIPISGDFPNILPHMFGKQGKMGKSVFYRYSKEYEGMSNKKKRKLTALAKRIGTYGFAEEEIKLYLYEHINYDDITGVKDIPGQAHMDEYKVALLVMLLDRHTTDRGILTITNGLLSMVVANPHATLLALGYKVFSKHKSGIKARFYSHPNLIGKPVRVKEDHPNGITTTDGKVKQIDVEEVIVDGNAFKWLLKKKQEEYKYTVGERLDFKDEMIAQVEKQMWIDGDEYTTLKPMFEGMEIAIAYNYADEGLADTIDTKDWGHLFDGGLLEKYGVQDSKLGGDEIYALYYHAQMESIAKHGYYYDFDSYMDVYKISKLSFNERFLINLQKAA